MRVNTRREFAAALARAMMHIQNADLWRSPNEFFTCKINAVLTMPKARDKIRTGGE